MKSVALIVAWLAVSVLAAALLAPWLYLATENAAHHFPLLHGLAGHKFHRYINRLVMIFAVLGVVGIGRFLGYRKAAALGLGGSHRPGRAVLGFVVSVVFLGILAGLLLATGCVRFRSFDAQEVAMLTASVTLAAVAVGFLEELFFRGFLYDLFRREFNFWFAILVVSAFFASVHFVKSPGEYKLGPVKWDTALLLLPRYVEHVPSFEAIFFSALNLFLVGCILAWAYEETGNLYLSIGLHAGWIFALQLSAGLTEVTGKCAEGLLGFGDLRGSPLATVLLVLQWVVLRRLSRELVVLGP
ncbi:MAG: CPBP family intramembrane metalloprotease [Verrucomicrobiae bacterium]|nr:CPBP family intramembrane metalloprotease [Verrucomicrobiae bacterium]